MSQLLIVIAIAATIAAAFVFMPEQPAMEMDDAPSEESISELLDSVRDTVGAEQTVDLSNQGLSRVSASMFSNANVTTLDLSYNNNLTGALPAEVRQLKNLKVLNLSHNQFTGVPAEIGQLSQLEVLDLSYNQLTGLPYELGNLSKLQQLDLRGNNYATADLERIAAELPDTTVILTE